MTIEPGQRRAGKRGKLPARPGSMPLKFGNYLNAAKLPNLPERFGHVTNVPPGRNGWGMLGNDVASDCVIAGRCHEIIVAAVATRRPIPDFSPGSAIADYSRALVFAGGQRCGQDDVVGAEGDQRGDVTGLVRVGEACDDCLLDGGVRLRGRLLWCR